MIQQGSSRVKPPFDSCNFNSPGNERAFPSKLTPFELGEHQPVATSKPIPINQNDATRSENIQASWSTLPQPARVPNPSPQLHGPINGIPQRRDSESSGTGELIFYFSSMSVVNIQMYNLYVSI